VSIDTNRVASILVEAAYHGDKETAGRWSITTRTIQRYRERLNEDSELSQTVALKKQQYEADWANEIPGAIRSAVRFLQRASNEANPKDPDTIHAVAGALKILAEVGITKAILDVRLSGFIGANGAEDTAMDAAPKQLQQAN
jgi:hypothetical protein